jgi:hypothetical protein
VKPEPKLHARWLGLVAVAAAFLTLLTPLAYAAEELSATPYRPTVSNPAALSAPGHFEIEAGVLRTKNDDPRRRDSLPVLFKYAFTENVGVLLGGEAYVRYYSDIDGNATGVGDTNVILKLHHAVNDKLAVGLEAGVKLPTAKDPIGSGKHDQIVNGIVSAELGKAELDVNLGVQRLGAINPGESRTAYAWAAALSYPFNDKWGIAGEVSGVSQRGVPGTAQFLAAVSYNVSKTVVLDAGMAWGLNRASIDHSLFAGITVLLK